MTRKKTVLLGAVVSLLCLWLALRNIDWAMFVQSLASFRWRYLPLMALLVLGDIASRAVRWRFLLPSGPRNTFALLFRLEAIGLALNNVVPFRLGEVARAYLAAKELGLPFLTALATVFVERLLDALSMLALFIFAGDWGGDGGWTQSLRHTARVGLALGAAGLFALVWLEGLLERNPRLHAFLQRHPRLQHFMEQIILGTQSLRTWGSALLVFALGFGLWFFDALQLYAAGAAFSIEVLTFRRSITLLMVAMLAVAVPGVPGYFGAYELAVSKALARFGAPHGLAFSHAGVVHLTSYIVTTLLGIAFLYKEGHSLASLRQALDRPRPERG